MRSGWRCVGSSTGSGSYVIVDDEAVTSTAISASCVIVYSFGLPMLIGPVCSPSSRARKPRTSSSTKQNDRVWLPSPNTVIGSPRSAWTRKLDTDRPSSTRMFGPYVLKMRTMRTSTPWWRWYAIVSASAKRFASSYTPRGPIGLTWPQYVSGCGWTCGSP